MDTDVDEHTASTPNVLPLRQKCMFVRPMDIDFRARIANNPEIHIPPPMHT